MSSYLFPVDNWRPASLVNRTDALTIVTNHDIAPDYSLYLFPGHFPCIHFIKLFFLQCCEKTFHTSIVVAFPDITHALNSPIITKQLLTSVTRIPAAGIAMNENTAPRISAFLCIINGANAQFLFHMVIHCDADDFSSKTIQDWCCIQLPVRARDFGNISQSLLIRLCCAKVHLQYIFWSLSLFICLCKPVWTPVTPMN